MENDVIEALTGRRFPFGEQISDFGSRIRDRKYTLRVQAKEEKTKQIISNAMSKRNSFAGAFSVRAIYVRASLSAFDGNER